MQKKQFGRSMIEMLGVLAIIGVLSIGGLLGYRRAVNNHQANQILDDANRLAFVVMESGQAFEPYNNITGLEFTQTSPYFMNAFTEATSQQFAIMVTNLPKGVCEALLPKAAVEYKVRTLKAQSVQYPEQVSVYGELYDEQNTDICNDMNDVVLYFGDTSKQYNPTGEEECTSYMDCPNGAFCFFANASDTEGTGNGPGECQKILSYDPETTTMSDGKTWTRSKKVGLNWWSAMDWCEAQRKTPVTRTDVGSGCASEQPCSSTIMSSIRAIWTTITGTNYWLNSASDTAAFVMAIRDDYNFIGSTMKHRTDYYNAFCH